MSVPPICKNDAWTDRLERGQSNRYAVNVVPESCKMSEQLDKGADVAPQAAPEGTGKAGSGLVDEALRALEVLLHAVGSRTLQIQGCQTVISCTVTGQAYKETTREQWEQRDENLRVIAERRREQIEDEADEIDTMVDCSHKQHLLNMNDAKYEQWRKRYRLLTDYENFNGDAEQLRWAAQDGDLETCRRLVASGVSVNAPGRQGKAPLHYAAERGNREVAEFLMDSAACVLLRGIDASCPHIGTPWTRRWKC